MINNKDSKKNEKKRTYINKKAGDNKTKADNVNKVAGNSINPRNLVLSTLEKINREDCYCNIAIKQVLDDNPQLEARDKALVKRLVEGCVERQIELDYIISQVSKTPVNKLKPVIKEILRMGIYQIIYMDNIPDSAACNEAVKLTTKRGFVNLKGYVNGVLRNVTRGKSSAAPESLETDTLTEECEENCIKGTSFSYPSKKKAVEEFFSIKYSTPTWLIDMWIKEHGVEVTEKILKSFLEERPVCIRVKCVDGNPIQLSSDTLACLKAMNTGHAGLVSTEHAKKKEQFCYELISGTAPSSLKEFEAGLITVQDPASVQAVLSADIKPGDTVIDVCAAPGGKSIFAGELAGKSGKVLAFDISDKKIPIMNQNKLRMKADNVTFAVGDATEYKPELKEKADVVLCDVPCSGLGVIGKKRDIKYKADENRIKGLLPIQRDILENVCNYVKPGGRLCYSTCTISKRENELQVEGFLKTHSEFSLIDMKQLFPFEGSNDGFFIAVLCKQMAR